MPAQLVKSDLPNVIYSSGASNKRFEYMAVGVPQITNQGPGMDEIITRPNCGALADPSSPEDIGLTIARLLQDTTLRKQLSDNARKAHLGAI